MRRQGGRDVFKHWIENRRGAVTIMLTFLLLAVMSLNSTLIETARYKSLERLYKEMEENAAFSVLSKYDRDLYKSYGLLAVNQMVDKDDFINYLQANMNTETTDANGVDTMLNISADNVKMDKIYNLAQEEVLKMQINEFCAYRAPITMVNEALNIEETIDGMIKNLENSLPVLKLFNKLVKLTEKMSDMYTKLYEYKEKSVALKGMSDEYKNDIEKYNKAVEARDILTANYEAQSELEEGEESSSNQVSYEEYQKQLENANSQIESEAAALRSTIEQLKGALAEQFEAYNDYMEAYEAVLGAEVESVLTAATADADSIEDESMRTNAKKMISDMSSAYKETDSIAKEIKEVLAAERSENVEYTQLELIAQKESLTGEGSNMGKTDSVIIVSANFLTAIVDLLLTTVGTIEELAQQWSEMLRVLSEVLDALKLFTTGGFYDPELNNVIPSNVYGNLPGKQHGGNELVKVSNEFMTEDEAAKNAQIAETEYIANMVNFDTSTLDTNDRNRENNALLNAMNHAVEKWKALDECIRNLNSAVGILSVLSAIVNLCVNLVGFITSLIELVEAFITALASGIMHELLYQRVYPAVYANGMFSNRTTDLESDKKLNRSSFADYSAALDVSDICFDQANGEYILVGSSDEIVNQEGTFIVMLAYRMLCNIVVPLTDTAFMEIFTGLCASLIGIIFAILFYIVVVVVEAYSDMIFLIYGDSGVDAIKLEGYFKFDGSGLDKFAEQAKELVDKTMKVAGVESKKEEQSFGEEYVEGLLKWNYKDHMLVLFMLFLRSEVMYARCADLIEMDMKKTKLRAGEDEFRLSEMATFIRVDSTAEYTPLLPIPTLPGLNSDKLQIHNVHYSGY